MAVTAGFIPTLSSSSSSSSHLHLPHSPRSPNPSIICSLGRNQHYSSNRAAVAPSRPRRRPRTTSPPKRRQPTQSPNRKQTKRSVEVMKEKRIWKEGEFPGDNSIITPRRNLVKNVKKRIDYRTAAKAWTPTVTEILADVIQKKQWKDALEVFDMLKEQPFYKPKVGMYMKLLVLLGKSGKAEHAHKLFDTMIQEGIEPNPEVYTALLAAYCRSNLIDNAFSVLNRMKTLPLCQPDVYTYSILIKACVEDEFRFGLVDALLEEMTDRGITPNTVTQNTLLSGYGKARRFDMMETLLSTMLESNSCKPDVWTMNTIITLFGNNGEIDMLEKWYAKFCSIGIKPDRRTFNILIHSYGRRRMYEKMTAVMDHMRKSAVPWTTATYNNVIEAFADAGVVEQMEDTFDQMRAGGTKPDTKTFCWLINGFSNAGLHCKIAKTVKLVEKLDVATNSLYYNSVVSALAKAGDLVEMEKALKRMMDKHHAPDSTTISFMVEAYKKEGMNDKVYWLYALLGFSL